MIQTIKNLELFTLSSEWYNSIFYVLFNTLKFVTPPDSDVSTLCGSLPYAERSKTHRMMAR